MMPLEQTAIGMTVILNMDIDTAQARVVEALNAEGFGVLTEIDVRETLRKKLNIDFRPYRILGACNPPLAHRALSTAPEIGLLLPCNVTLAALEDGRTQVGLVNPLAMMSAVPNPALEPIAREAAERLNRVRAALEA